MAPYSANCMTIAAGTRFGPYEILTLIRAGGMGEVYRARDARLSRDVALKVLPADIAGNPVRRARFEREAQVISRLNHPNICAVYDVGTEHDVAYLVMEYIAGESLAERLRRGPLPPAVAMRWAIQIAAALDAAHRRGITHRDLKPANVMISDQQIKLLDFGLAKLHEDPPARDASTISLTAEHSVIGTLHYMAPEQLEGRQVDPRTDLFAFGTVLYEMLTARKPFDGASDATVIAAILTAEPQAMSAFEAGVPAALDRIVRRALAKAPDERWQTARDVMNELQWLLEIGSRNPVAPWLAFKEQRHTTALAVAALALCVGFAAHALMSRGESAPPTPVHLSFVRPAGLELTNTGRPVVAISPDGKKIVFNANNQLYIRKLDADEAVPIAGTQGTGVTTPFFSPDGRWVGFFSIEAQELKKVPADGGAAVTICVWPEANFGATWTTDDRVLFAAPDGVYRVSPGGGTPEKVFTPQHGEAVHGPQMLPDRDHLLLTVTTGADAERWNRAQIVAYSLSSGVRTLLVEGGADGRYADSGHLLYAAGTTVFAVPLNLRSLRTLGAPVAILSGVRRAPVPGTNTAAAFFATARTGNLVYIPDQEESFVNVAVDFSGRTTPLPAGGLRAVSASPDGFRVVANYDRRLWMYSLTRHEAPRRLSDAEDEETNPVWSPDGTRIVVRSRSTSGGAILSRAIDAAEQATILLPVDGVPVAWSRDGQTLFYLFDRQLWTWRSGEVPRPLMPLDTPYASLSADRRWVAYHTREHGRVVPYIQSLVNRGARFQIAEMGHAPLWSPDSRKLFYVAGETNSLMMVDVHTSPAVTFGDPVVLVPELVHGLALSQRWYDITPDGTRLLVQVPDRKNIRSRQIEVVLNWFEELERRVPGPRATGGG